MTETVYMVRSALYDGRLWRVIKSSNKDRSWPPEPKVAGSNPAGRTIYRIRVYGDS